MVFWVREQVAGSLQMGNLSSLAEHIVGLNEYLMKDMLVPSQHVQMSNPLSHRHQHGASEHEDCVMWRDRGSYKAAHHGIEDVAVR